LNDAFRVTHEPLPPATPDGYPAFSEAAGPVPPVRYYLPVRQRFQDRVWKHVVLLLLTLCTTTLVGVDYYGSFLSQIGQRPLAPQLSVLAGGLWYSLSVLLILGAHEMGHYLCCRYYNLDASLPFFLPLPLQPTGTLGAVIKIREPFPTKTVLFDVGIAGPIAGFLTLVPVLILGVAWSEVIPLRHIQAGLEFGEPLLLRGISKLVFGTLSDAQMLNAHPLVFAAWFGMLATALNLLPFGQLDGGHITHAVFNRRSTLISLVTVICVATMSVVTKSWIATTVIMLLMLVLVGPRHPRVMDEDEPLGPGRRALAVFALVMLVVCITPIPITIVGP
jgi:membrane-associated protease RseP (regulator of RpoE activity)